jgi:CubicO group peptidase (beta-lactamase class C family)
MAEIHGTCDDRFVAMKQRLSNSLDSGGDVGASVAVALRGEMVVDMWGGFADAERTQPWQADTITNVWSTTKTMIFLSALMLVDRGQLDLWAPVAHYWPEFAAEGKGAIEVRQLLSHTSGVSGWNQPVTVEDLYDWEKSTSMLAAQAPWWEPGTASGYHALNQGHLIGEVIRRITGMQPGEFFAREIAGPLGADFHIGLDPSQFHRVANVIPPEALPFDMSTVDFNSPMIKTFTGPMPEVPRVWTPEWRQADIGAANGHGNARSVALVQSAITNGGAVGTTQLLSAKTIELIFDVQSDGPDLVLGIPVKFGMGYGLPEDNVPYLDNDRTCYWGGYGGSVIVNDVSRGLTVTYMMNRMEAGLVGDERGIGLIRDALAAVTA